MINKQVKLIDGKELLEWLDGEIALSSGNSEVEKADRWAFRQVKKAIHSGRFDAPSDSDGEWKAISEVVQRENAQLKDEVRRLRVELEKIANYERNEYESDLVVYAKCKRIAIQALSTTEPTGAQRCVELPLADEAERQGGWTLSPRYLDEIQDKIEGYEDCPSWEGIQLVLLAHNGLPLPKGDGDDA